MNKRNAIVLITDSNLLSPAMHLWSRLQDLNTRLDTDIVLVLPDADAKKLRPNAGARAIPSSALKSPNLKFSGPKHITSAAYLKITAPGYLRHEYAKVLYLDIDVVVKDSSLFRIFDCELTTPLAATRWHKNSFDPRKVHNGKVREGAYEFDRYFNSGVLYIDVDRYADAQVETKALAFLADKEGKTATADQTALNLAVLDNWQELSPSFNFRAELLRTHFADVFPPVVIHYVGDEKSWHIPSVPHPLRTEQLKWLAKNGYFRFLLENIRPGRFRRAMKRRRKSKDHRLFPYINVENPLIRDYLAVPFVDHWNVHPNVKRNLN
jgi:lipopolysaccharide biosynthesis glycosyltransferase